MRQRNETAHALYVPADPPFEVLPGDIVDYPHLLVGLTEVTEPAPKAKAKPSDKELEK